MDTADAMIVFIFGFVSGVLGTIFYKAWYVRRPAMDEPWMKEQGRKNSLSKDMNDSKSWWGIQRDMCRKEQERMRRRDV